MTTLTLTQLADRKARAQRRLGRLVHHRARQQLRFLIAWYEWQQARHVLALANTLHTQQCRSYAMRNLNRAARAMREQWQHLQWSA